MLIDAKHKPWAWWTLLAAAVSTAAYVYYAQTAPHGPRGGSVPGLLFGVAGSLLMVAAAMVWVRKRVPRWPIGSAQSWLRAHIWLGLLSILLILFHAGFGLGGLLEQALMAVVFTLLASGLFGVVVQQFVPRGITARVTVETFYEQLPHVCSLLQMQGDIVVAGCAGPLALEPLAVEQFQRLVDAKEPKVAGTTTQMAVYAGQLEADSSEADAVAARPAAATAPAARRAPATAGQSAAAKEPRPAAPRRPTILGAPPQPGGELLWEAYRDEVRPYLAPSAHGRSPLAGLTSAANLFAQWRTVMPAGLHGALQELEALCGERRALAAQARLHHWLHLWLHLHVPLTLVLAVLGVLHVVMSLYY